MYSEATPEVKAAIHKQRRLADKCLDILQDYDAVVAGGAPRDWYLGKTAKDIDIFLGEVLDKEVLENLFGVQLEEIKGKYQYPEFQVFSFYEEGQEVQLIISLREELPALDIVSSFAAATSRVTYKDGVIKPSPEFVFSVTYGVILIWNEFGFGQKYAEKIERLLADNKPLLRTEFYTGFGSPYVSALDYLTRFNFLGEEELLELPSRPKEVVMDD